MEREHCHAYRGLSLHRQLTEAPRLTTGLTVKVPWCPRGTRHGLGVEGHWEEAGMIAPEVPQTRTEGRGGKRVGATLQERQRMQGSE